MHRDDNHKPQLTLLACTDGTMLHEEAGVEWSDRKFECASPSPMVLVPVPGAPDVVVVAVGRALVYCRWAPVTFDYAVHKEGGLLNMVFLFFCVCMQTHTHHHLHIPTHIITYTHRYNDYTWNKLSCRFGCRLSCIRQHAT